MAASATTALVATMMFGGGGFNPAAASPSDNKDASVEQALSAAVEGSEASAGSNPAKAKTATPEETTAEAPLQGTEPSAGEELDAAQESAAPTSEAPSTSTSTDSRKPATPSAEAPTKSEAKTTEEPAETSASGPNSALAKDGPVVAAVAGVCDTNIGKGKVDSFMQRAGGAAFANGNLSSGIYEGGYVDQRVEMSGMEPGENEFVFTYRVRTADKWAYDFIDQYSMTGGTITNIAVTEGSGSDREDTVKLTFDATASAVTLYFSVHVASELDHGPGAGASAISGSPYHVSLVSLNCATAGNRANQISASDVQAGFVTIIKDAIPADGTDFDFTLGSGTTEDSVNFRLDDSAGSNIGADLPDRLTYTVAPGGVTISENALPEGWNLTNLTCSGVTPTIDTSARSASFALADNAQATCTFTNNKTTYKDLEVTTTAKATFDRDYDWSIEKNLAAGQASTVKSATGDVAVNYSVLVDASAPQDSNFAVDGVVTVVNGNNGAIGGVTLTDSIPGAVCAIETSAGTAVSGPVSVPAGTTTFNYTCEMPSGTTEASTGTNTVTATWNAASYYGTDGSAAAAKDFTFAGVQPTVTDDSVTVTDSKFNLSTLPGGNVVAAGQAPKRFDYAIAWPGVAGECTAYDNTAKYTETDGGTASDTATVDVCLGADLVVTKNVVASFNRSYLWEIDKTPVNGAGPYTTDANGEVLVDYKVTVKPKDPVDSAWAMSGDMTVKNPNKWQDITATLGDTVDVGGGAVCTVAGATGTNPVGDADPNTEGFQAVIPRDSVQAFGYSCTFESLPSYEGTNTAKATWDAVKASTPHAESTGTAAVAMGTWTQTPLNNAVTVTDDHHAFDPAWTITWSEGMGAQIRDYTAKWTVPEASAGKCMQFTNTATAAGGHDFAISDKATIKACRPAGLSVKKTVDAGYDRTYLWDIAKTAVGPDTLNTGADHTAVVDYDITATSKGYKDDAKTLNGEITVTNPNTFGGDVEVTVEDTTTLAGVACTVDPAADANPDADGVQVVVPQAAVSGEVWVNGTKKVAYNCDASSVTEANYTGQKNTASITWNGGQASSQPVDIVFGLKGATDETVEVLDQLIDPDSTPKNLGTVSWSEIPNGDWATWSKTFKDEITHAATPGECTPFTNKAWVELGDHGTNPSSDATVTVCDQAGLQVSKTANASFDRLYKWNATKDVDRTEQTVAPDGPAVFNYTVKAVPNGFEDFGETLDGKITLTNPNQFEAGAITATLTDTVGIAGVSCEIRATDIDPNKAGLQVRVPAGTDDNPGSLVLDYECTGVPATYTGTNTVDVTWKDTTDTNRTATASAKVEYVLDTEYDKNVMVFDDKVFETEYPELLGKAAWNAEKDPTEFTYDLMYTGTPGTCAEYTNTAIVTEDGWNQATLDSASRKVTLCVEQDLEVAKDVTATFDRDYDWKIEKAADKASFNVDGDGKVTAGYKVAAAKIGHTDSGWQLGGTITVHNPNDFGSITANVEDTLDLDGVRCTVVEGKDVEIAAGDTAELNYGCDVAAGVVESDYAGAITNTATATWGEGRSASSGPVAVDFKMATETDTHITVTDDRYTENGHVLGTAKLEESPKTFSYVVDWEAATGKCTTFTNTAVIDGDANHPAGNESSADIEVCVEKGLTVLKTVEAGFTRDYDWDLKKKADQARFTVDENGKATANYTVTATQAGHEDQDWTMSGSIDVFNPNRQGELTVDISDVTTVPGATCTVAGGGADVVVPAATVVDGVVTSGKSTVGYDCVLTDPLTAADYEGHTNTATVTWSGTGSEPRTAEFEASVVFTQAAGIDETVKVVDDQTVPGAAHELGTATRAESPQVFTYPLELAGKAGECTSYTNTAVLGETTGTDEADNTATADVEVCAKAGLEVSKTARASFDRLYTWELMKGSDETKLVIDPDGTAVFNYAVSAIPDGFVDSGEELTGTITLSNPNRFEAGAITATLTDTVDIAGLGCEIRATDIDPNQEGLQVLVPAGTDGNPGTLVLDYECTGVPASYTGTNSVDVSWKDTTDTNRTATASAEVKYVLDTATDKTVQVLDDKVTETQAPVKLGEATWNAEGTATKFTYPLGFAGNLGKCTDYTNTAILARLGDAPATLDSASRKVTVCVEQDLVVTKNAKASYDRDYDWKIEKRVDKTSFNVDGDGNVLANYTVTATQNGHTDSGWKLGGKITVDNPNSFGSITANVVDTLDLGGISCTVAGGQDVEIAAGDTAELGYGCDVAAGVDEAAYTGAITNTATATWGENRSASSDPVAVDFMLDRATDASVEVFDDKTDPDAEPARLGTATPGDGNVFTYGQELAGTAGKCTTFTNTAAVKEAAGADGDNTDSVAVEVCAEKGLTAVKTVDAGFTRDYAWDIDKTVDRNKVTVDGNGKVRANYTVTATKNGHSDQDWTMSGSIDVFNPNRQAGLAVDIADVTTVPGATCTVAGGGTDVVVPAATVVDGVVTSGKATVGYDCVLAEPLTEDDYEGHTNTALVTWSGADGKDRSAEFVADVLFTRDQAKDIDGEVAVLDDKTVPGAIHELGTATAGQPPREFTYQVELAGRAGTCTTYANTAVLGETTGTDEADNTATADVEVCAMAGLEVSDPAEATFDREYLWKLDKKVDRARADIGLDSTATFDYTVTATPDGYVDSNHQVAGTITLGNPNQFAGGDITATLTGGVDIAGVACAIDATDADPDTDGFQVLVPAGATGTANTVTLAYTCTGTPENGDHAGEHTVTATWATVQGGDAYATASAKVLYEQVGSANADLEVLDDKAATVPRPVKLGTADWNADSVPTEFTYQVIYRNPDRDVLDGTCTTHENTATSIATDDASASVEVCVQVGAPTAAKTVTGTHQNADGSWEITYKLEVTNNDAFQGRYSLGDTLSFGGGIEVTDASWTGPEVGDGDAWDLGTTNRTEVLATDAPIGAGETHTYLVSATANAARGVTGSAAGDCELAEGEDGTGFLNTATLTANGRDTKVAACAAPVAPTFDKQAIDLVQHEDADGNWDGTWDASYKLTVSNPGTNGQDVFYSLSDTPAFADGVLVNDRTAGSGDVAVNAGWNGTDPVDDVVVSGQVLEAGEVHTFTAVLNLSLTSAITDADRTCGEGGHGLLNTGEVGSGNESATGRACLDIPAPGSNVVKTAESAVENADGSWDVDYTVVVNNTSDVATRYDLGDTLRFGKGLTATGADWSLEGTDETGSWADPGSEPGTVLATDRTLEARDSHTYRVHVAAVLQDGVVGSAAASCPSAEGNADGGFLNEATLGANGKTSHSRDCVEPVDNPRSYSLVKTADPASGTVAWPGDTITYTLTVRNTGEFVYTGAVVTDQMAGWQQAATLNEGSLKASGGEFAIEGSRLLWTVGDLAVGEAKTLAYSITVNDGAWDAVLVNVATGSGDVPESKTTHRTPVPVKHSDPSPRNPVQVIQAPVPLQPAATVPPRRPVATLADTGAPDSTLWVLGSGALFMLLGAAFVAGSRRRKGEGN